ncbi:MAG: hypothetical protein ACK5O2_08785 [Microthrixaceae bacterium]
MAKRKVTDAHKKAMAQGRTESRVVKEYLEALDRNRPRRGRKRTPDSINKRLAAIESELPDADPLKKVSLIQERMDLATELETLSESDDISATEAAFVKVAKDYSERKGITWAAWREAGVGAPILKAAGVPRS